MINVLKAALNVIPKQEITYRKYLRQVPSGIGLLKNVYDGDVKVIATVSKEGCASATKELSFTVLKKEKTVYYSENFYSPENADKEIVNYNSVSAKNESSFLDWNYSNTKTNFCQI